MGTHAPLLSREEEREAIRLAQDGDTNALKCLVDRNLRLVWKLVSNCQTVHLSQDDLLQEGVIGLIIAIRKFDLDRGVRLSTYAVYWIKQAINRAMQTKEYTVRLSTCSYELRDQIRQFEGKFEIQRGREPTDDEIATALNTNASLVTQLKQYCQPMFLDEVFFDDGSPVRLGETVVDEAANDPFCMTLATITNEKLRRALSALSEEHRFIIVKRFGLDGEEPCTLRKLGESLHKTAEAIRQAQIVALRKLRYVLSTTAGDL